MPARAVEPLEVAFASQDGTALKAWLFLPAQAPGDKALATVVALHGCGGLYSASGRRKGQLNARHQAAADLLVAEGYAVLFPDSFRPRGVESICAVRGRARTVTQAERRRDALAALAWARAQPWADPQRVAVLGWSHGGSAVLSATDANHAEVKAQPAFQTAIAFYPGCAEARKALYRPSAPLALFLAADDDWTPPGACVELATHLQNEKLPVAITVFPGAVHGFDDVGEGPPRERPDVPSRLHPGRGVMQGPKPEAREAAWTRVREILREALR